MRYAATTLEQERHLFRRTGVYGCALIGPASG